VRRKHQQKLFNNASNFSPSLHLLEENLATLHFSVLLKKTRNWNKIFIEKIDQLISAGIAQRIQLETPPFKKEEQDPERLTMDHLGVCFIIVGIFWALSCVVFAAEWFTKLVNDSIRERFGDR
jgi:hypothetical protein